MSLVFSTKEIEELENAICNSTFNRSFSSHKKDVKKFLLAHFKKNKSESKISNKKDVKEEKMSGNPKEKNGSRKVSDPQGPKDGYRIMEITSGYGYPTSVYKKDIPIKAAESAVKGIIRKNKLGSDAKFTFSIKKENRAFRYTYENGKLNAHHGR